MNTGKEDAAMKRPSKLSPTLLLVGAVLLASCAVPIPPAQAPTTAPGATSAATAAAPPAEKITLKIWRPGGAAVPPERANYWWDDNGEILAKWAEANPNIEIKIETIPFEQFDTKELTALKGGGAPDIMFVNHVTVGAAAGTGGLEPLEPCLTSQPTMDPKDWIPGMWAVGTREGKQYTVPWDTDTRVLWYNKKLLAEAGVNEPPKTWEELQASVKKIADLKKDGVYPWYYFGGSYWGVLYQDIGPWLVQMDTSFLTPDGTKSAALDPKTVQAFTHAVNLAKYAPEAAVNNEGPESDALFAQGKLAYYVWGMWYTDTLKQQNPNAKFDVDYSVALLPGPEAGKTGSSNGGWQLAISKDSKYKNEACKFLAWVTSPDIMALGTKAHIPTRLSAQKASYFKGDPVVEKSMEQAAFGRPPVATVPQLPELAQLVQKQFIRAVRGEVTPEQALTEIDKQITDLLKK
jgi:multiple sugar transport system substrate-binding protein